MSLVQTDTLSTNDKDTVRVLYGALADEVSATNLYMRIRDESQRADVQAVVTDIMKEELNHQGKLLSLIFKIDQSLLEPFNKGLGGEDE